MEKNTEQRQAIRRVIERAERPLSLEEIHREARERTPDLGIAAVHRNLQALLADRWLQVVPVPGRQERYELAGSGHHSHFHCRGCDQLFTIPDPAGQAVELAPVGFHSEGHELFLYGLCRDCTPQA